MVRSRERGVGAQGDPGSVADMADGVLDRVSKERIPARRDAAVCVAVVY
jgi:hypothetical protein